MTRVFRAMVVREGADGSYRREIEEKRLDSLPQGEVLVRVQYSSLNYKDALSATGAKGVTSMYPHTPGIDAAGVVQESMDGRFAPGDEVVVTSFDLGMDTPGGFGQYIRVPADWVVPLPGGLDLRKSMIYGTAGFTAALSVRALQVGGVRPEQGEVLVTGATGGVGSIAVALLAAYGYPVVAATGKSEEVGYLEALGAGEVIDRDAVLAGSPRPLLRGRWAGVVDTVGGGYLAGALKAVKYGGVVAVCGLVSSPKLNTTVLPFILRGVHLAGIDSQNCPMPLRLEAWQELAKAKISALESVATDRSLDGLDPEIELILQGGQRGRIVVNLWP
jgi:putative YhdH/YhfP family quinone oxidoreductase